MIPLTREMDTLVLAISTQPSRIKRALSDVPERRDFVTWIRL
jgi:hypothetical protein